MLDYLNQTITHSDLFVQLAITTPSMNGATLISLVEAHCSSSGTRVISGKTTVDVQDGFAAFSQ